MKVSEHREAIVRLRESGMKPLAIARRLVIAKSTVYDVIKQWKQTGSIKEKLKSGRKRSVNTRKIRAIIKKRINRNDGVSMNKMSKDLKISRHSVQSIVHNELGLKSYRLLSGQVLNDKMKQNRLDKCKKLQDFFIMHRVEDVLWSDEKIFTVEVTQNSQNHRQLLSPALKNTRKRKVATKSLFPKSLMIWAGIGANGKTQLVFIDKHVKINAQIYQNEILDKAVLPWIQKNPNTIFQQDWAPAHGAKSTIAYLEAKVKNYLTKDQWPSNSPDLNPLDFSVWGYIEERLRTRKITDLGVLKKALLKEWNDMDPDYLRRTINSLPKRIQACIDADGGHFENLV